MARDTGPLGCWSYLRAALITLALLVQCVNALPDKPLTDAKLSRPESRRALRWLSSLSSASDPEASTRAQLIAWSERGIAARRWLLAPFSTLLHAAALRQQWNLFVTVSDDAYRMRIDVQAAGDESWRMIYRANELDTLGLAPMLDYRRVRGIYNPNKYGTHSQYAAFTGWLARRVLHDHPELSALRVSMERIAIGEPHSAGRLLDTRYAFEHARAELP